jgi:vacuolar protein sorting-associated protein 29
MVPVSMAVTISAVTYLHKACFLFILHHYERMLVPNKMQHILCTGNIGSKGEYEKLRELAPNVHVVCGDYEYNRTLASSAANPYGSSTSNMPNKRTTFTTASVFPDTKVIQVGEFRIGIINGYQIIPHNHMTLGSMRRKLDVDILITGHTHKNEVVKHEGFWHINPVSLSVHIFFIFDSFAKHT